MCGNSSKASSVSFASRMNEPKFFGVTHEKRKKKKKKRKRSGRAAFWGVPDSGAYLGIRLAKQRRFF